MPVIPVVDLLIEGTKPALTPCSVTLPAGLWRISGGW